ncbi:NAD-specific glutamate dehydrogenase [compost metagenome]
MAHRDAERVGRDVGHHHFLQRCILGLEAGLHGGTQCDDFIGVEVDGGEASEHRGCQPPHDGHARGTARENDRVQFRCPQVGVAQRAFDRRAQPLEQWCAGLFEQGFVEREPMLHGLVRDDDLGARVQAQRLLRGFGLRSQSLHELGVVAQARRQSVAFEEQGDQRFDEVFAAQEVVARRRTHLHHTLEHFEDRYVESATAEVEHQKARFGAHVVHAVGECRGGGLVQQPVDLQAGEFARRTGGFALRIRKVRGHGDDGFMNWFAQHGLGIGLE